MTATERVQTLDALKPYPAYKDSGVEWIGDIPTGWSGKRLKQLTLSARRGEGPTYVEDSEVWVINQACVRWDGLDLSRKKFNDPEARPGKGRLRNKDVLINSTGNVTLGRSTVFQEVPGQVCIADNHITIVRTDESAFLPHYLNYLNSTPEFQALTYATLVVGATAQIELSRSALLDTAFPKPTTTEQAAIAAFLDHETARIDALVREQELLLEDLAEKRTALVSNVINFGLNPAAPSKPSGTDLMQDIPGHWTVKKLKRISPEQSVGVVINPSSYVDPEGSVPFLVGSNVSEMAFNLKSMRYITDQSNVQLSKTRLRSGDLVTVRVGAPGVTAVIPDELDGCNCASVMITRQDKTFNSRWLAYAMNSEIGRGQVRIVQYGAAQEQFNISHGVDFVYPVPPLEEQHEMVEFLDQRLAQLEKLVLEVRANIEDMKLLRSTLITAATTGKIDVRDWRPA